MQATPTGITRGREALRAGDAVGSRRAFEEALADVGSTAEVLEGLGSASYVLMDYTRAGDELQRAYAAYRAAGDGSGAVRMARMIAPLYGVIQGNWAVAGGWIARARSLLHDHPDSRERGWVGLCAGMFEPDRATKERFLTEAIEAGVEVHDNDLRFGALAYLGASQVHADRVPEGMALLDEALAAVAGGEVESFIVVEEIFCQLFAACERAQDVRRAEEWIREGERIAAQRRLPAVTAYCRTHYGAILTVAGRWPEAETALTEAVRLWTLGQRSQKNDALARLADLRVRQGRYDEAAALLDGLDSGDAVRPRAVLHLARAEAPLALDLLEHALRTADPASSACIPLLALLVDAQLACGEEPDALAELIDCTTAHPSRYAAAVAARAEALVRGDPGLLREAADGFATAELPLEAAQCRLELARLLADTRPDRAVVEARAAFRVFERFEAHRLADAAGHLLRRLGVSVPPPRTSGETLTRREREVLELLGAGQSNPEIAERLFISRKTVEHHVGNVLAKLGLRNRAEAAAYAVRQEPAQN